eukprot:SM000240S08603  [mRNA]  locus=s240:17999:18720:+ [translate_table: standard]
MKAALVAKSAALFVAAGVAEIGGGWLVWKWRRDGWHWAFFLLGSAVLVGYGIIPTLQDSAFGRTYAAYGGFFIVLSLLWGWAFDGNRPDLWDWLGAVISLAGVCIIMFAPRHHLQGSSLSPAPAPAPISQ